MSKVNQKQALNTLILSLEEKKLREFQLLKDQVRLTGESLRPVNLMKSAAEEITGNKQLKSYLIQAGIGLAVGLVTKKMLSTQKGSGASNLAGNLAELGINKLTGNQIALIKMAAPLIIGFIVNAINRRKKKKQAEVVA